jgi:transcriptional regulator with XRE-family HTH domain
MTKKRAVQEEQLVFQTYSHWDVDAPPTPPRSRLFRLPLIGVGSIEVESLTSYIARLAGEHCVSPRKLFCEEILAQVGRYSHYLSNSPFFSAHTVNGIGEIAEVTVKVLERLTLQQNLCYMTFLVWREVFAYNQLLRSHRAWCASCYQEQLTEQKYVYDPLIWSVEAVLTCHRHNELLCQSCPHCGGQLAFLAERYRPGYCSKCLKWLGVVSTSKSRQSKLKSLTTHEQASQIIILDIVGELLSGAPNVSTQPTRQTFLNNLSRVIEKTARSNINLFSDLVGMWSGKIRRLLAGESKLGIETLCHLCTKLNISPIDLLCERGRGTLSEKGISPSLRNDPTKSLTTPWSEVETNLRAALRESPPPSMEAVARRLGYYPPRLRGSFPRLCEQISSRYKTYRESIHPPQGIISATLRAALKEHPPPSLQSVFRKLGCRDTGYYYYSHYFNLCVAIAKRYKDHRNKPFNKELTQEQLTSALKEEPPPSFSSLAKRLGHNREFFRQKYPELTRAIASRHMQYRRNQQRERAERLRHMIQEEIKTIYALGLYVSERRVKENLRQHQFNVGRDSLFKQALREVKSEMGFGK